MFVIEIQSSFKTIILIRILLNEPHEKSIGICKKAYIEHITKSLNKIAKVYLLIDDHTINNKKTINFLQNIKKELEISYFLYNDTYITDHYKNAMWPYPTWITNKNKISYWIHEPSVIMWLKQFKISNNGSNIFQYVWVFEDDVFYVGNITKFIEFYNNNNADLIDTFNYNYGINWKDAFNWEVKHSEKLHKWEHIERYSIRLLNKIDEQLQIGHAAFGEMFSSTICYSFNSWCKIRDLRQDHFIPRHDIYFNGNRHIIKRKEFHQILKNPEFIGKWIHGVKWDLATKCKQIFIDIYKQNIKF